MTHPCSAGCAIAVVTLLLSPHAAVGVSWETILEDDFTTFNPLVWNVESNGGGGAGVNGGVLEIRSGPQDGGGAWVETLETFDVSACDFALTVVCHPESPVVEHNDSAHWGFGYPYPPSSSYSVLMFHVYTAHILNGPEWYAETSDVQSAPNGTVGEQHRRLLGVTGWEPMTEYRIEVIGGVATYFVNGQPVFTQSCPAIPLHPYHVRLDKTSPGQDRYLYVDYVKVERNAECVLSRPTVLFSSDRGNADGNLDIWAVRPDGTWPRRITNTPGVNELWPRISPDGLHVMATWQDLSLGTRGNGRLVRFNPDGGAYQEILTNVAHKGGGAAAWSADGARVVVSVHAGPDDEYHQLTSYELAPNGGGENPIPITTGAEANGPQAGDPRLSPDGTLVAFDGGQIGGRTRLFVVDAAGNHQISLNVGSGDSSINLQYPSWSPNASRIALMAEVPAGNHQLRLVEYPAAAQATFHTGYMAGYPVFVANDRVVFSSAEVAGSNVDLWLVNTDGSSLARLTDDVAVDLTPEFGMLVSDLMPDIETAAPVISRTAIDGGRWFTLRPNPSRGAVDILYDLPVRGPWSASIFDVAGHRVRSVALDAPSGLVRWDGNDQRGGPVAAGVYFVRLTGSTKSQSARVTLLR